MKIKHGFKMKEVCGENVITCDFDFTRMVSLNESAAYVWNAVFGKEFSIEDMVSALIEEYAIDEQTAFADCRALADSWKEAGLTED